MTTDPTAAGCTNPCIACMTDESHGPAPAELVPLTCPCGACQPEQTDPTQCSGDPGLCPEHGHHAESLKQPGEPKPAAPAAPAGRDLRADLLHAIDFNYVVGTLGYATPKDLLFAYDAARPAAAPPAPADGDLRDRIAQAIADATGNNWPAQAFTTEADAVLAVLPASSDQAIEEHRLALSEALGLGTGAPWDAIRDQAAAFRARLAAPDRDRIVTLDPADPMAQAIAEGHRTVVDALADAVLAVVPGVDRAGVLRAAAEQAGEKWTADLLKRTQQAREGRHAGRGQAARSCQGCQDDINAQLSDPTSKPIVICPGNEQAGEGR